jgi:hypothetical protein
MQKLGYFGIFWGRESIKGDLNSNFIYVKYGDDENKYALCNYFFNLTHMLFKKLIEVATHKHVSRRKSTKKLNEK